MNILSTQDLPDDFLKKLFEDALILQSIDGSCANLLSGKIMASVFLEPSTRTRLSFESAMLRLGGKVISIPEASGSSTSKGESLYDTIMTVSQYADYVVVRSSEPISNLRSALDRCPAHIINAGDGSNEHPTQALLDAYTIWKHFGDKQLVATVIGDLQKSRTLRSFVEVMGRKNHVCQYDSVHCSWTKDEVEYTLRSSDVIYLNRFQKERYRSEYNKYDDHFGQFSLNQEHLDLMKKDAIIMNPGPRRQELPAALDVDPRVVFFEQARNGVFARMALLKHLFEVQ